MQVGAERSNNVDIGTNRWTGKVLEARDSTWIIITKDRHCLKMVCRNMGDLE